MPRSIRVNIIKLETLDKRAVQQRGVEYVYTLIIVSMGIMRREDSLGGDGDTCLVPSKERAVPLPFNFEQCFCRRPRPG